MCICCFESSLLKSYVLDPFVSRTRNFLFFLYRNFFIPSFSVILSYSNRKYFWFTWEEHLQMCARIACWVDICRRNFSAAFSQRDTSSKYIIPFAFSSQLPWQLSESEQMSNHLNWGKPSIILCMWWCVSLYDDDDDFLPCSLSSRSFIFAIPPPLYEYAHAKKAPTPFSSSSPFPFSSSCSDEKHFQFHPIHRNKTHRYNWFSRPALTHWVVWARVFSLRKIIVIV